jgi:hypothetical protein
VENLPHVGVVGPLGSRWDIAAGEHLDWVRPREPSEALVCDVVSGLLFACFRETWEAAGGFDEAYAPASWERSISAVLCVPGESSAMPLEGLTIGTSGVSHAASFRGHERTGTAARRPGGRSISAIADAF